MANEWGRGDGEDMDDEEEFGPGSADYDLSDERGYGWEAESGGGVRVPQWLMAAVTLLALAGLVLPAIFLIYRYG